MEEILHPLRLPPPNFDPINSSDASLAEFWLPPRPDRQIEPTLYDHWLKMFSSPLHFVTPQSIAAPFSIGGPMLLGRFGGSRIETSSNFAGGYIVSRLPYSFTRIVGQWTIPFFSVGYDTSGAASHCCVTSLSLNGARRWSLSGLRIGAVHTVDLAGDGTARLKNSFWWQQWARNGAATSRVVANVGVNCGDDVSFCLDIASRTQARFHFKNQSTGVFITTMLQKLEPIHGSTAEWTVAQVFTPNGQALPLPYYNEIQFRGCAARAVTLKQDPPPPPPPPPPINQLLESRLIRHRNVRQTFGRPRVTYISVPEHYARLPGHLRVSYRHPEGPPEAIGSTKAMEAVDEFLHGGLSRPVSSPLREPAPAAREREVNHRYLVGNLPASARENETVELTVRVSTDAAPGRSDRLGMQVPAEGVLLDIVVTAPSFHLEGPATTKLFVPAVGASAFVMFRLRVLKPVPEKPEAQVHIAAVYRGTSVAALTLSVILTEAAPARQQPQADGRSKFSADSFHPGDASLYVNYDGRSKTYSFLWLDADGSQKQVSTEKIYEDLIDVIRNTAKGIDEIARLDYNFELASARVKLQTSGTTLWELLPDGVRSRLIDRWNDLERLGIYSDGDPIPWEMLYPYRQNPHFDGGQFLIEKFQIRRWVHGSLPPGAISLDRADFVVANPAELQQAGAEVQRIMQALAQWNTALSPSAIRAAAELYQLFGQDLLNLLHVACHQSFDGDNERIFLNNTPVGPQDFKNYRLTKHPFIFMNACKSDSKFRGYNGIGGWAKAFLGIGAGAFIGTLWEVRDTTAQLFAETLYTELLQNRSTFGAAIQRARSVVKKRAPGDPTWLAYTFYGDTDARLLVSLSSRISN